MIITISFREAQAFNSGIPFKPKTALRLNVFADPALCSIAYPKVRQSELQS